jgi:hypothetical protein
MPLVNRLLLRGHIFLSLQLHVLLAGGVGLGIDGGVGINVGDGGGGGGDGAFERILLLWLDITDITECLFVGRESGDSFIN